ncbi:MaoC domain protein dehydratase [Sphingobium chlorophenolicum L-1]|uniref:MaoC domain protein dehydratase n=1 Tax=Sphingobium chlorophenolicum L-1 TaxID=690566 RepID=F6EW95_SPHCR|nr:MaoC family dehydratase [Sphingobium chlorophenolicum]AEG49789.1 MaoC domain protein dehydratase [Sphingobium chlorophenolicum L-1]
MTEDVRARARLVLKGRVFDDFHVGQIFYHHWGRTISEADTLFFSALILAFNPLYLNRSYAIEHGHPDIVVNPQLVFNTILGISVEDCSEIGGPFLGVYDLIYDRPVYPGTTLVARSETVDVRTSESNPANGIVTWRTEGFDQDDNRVIGFRRSNLVRKQRMDI